MLAHLLQTLHSLTDPLRALLDASERIYLPFLVSSLLIAAGLYYWRGGHRLGVSLLSYLLPSAIYWHRSARLDYKLLFARSVVRVGLLGPLLLGWRLVAATVSTLLVWTLGDSPALAGSTTIVVLFTVLSFLTEDGSRYLVHRWMHRVPALWELHKLHHSAEVLTPLSLHRLHPVEGLINSLRSALVLGGVSGVFLYLYKDQFTGLEILGVDALGFLLNAAGANLRHSHVWLSYGSKVEALLISPAQHQVHHSQLPEHHDKNFGSFLALWDLLGGTLQKASRQPQQVLLGLPPEERNHRDTVLSALWSPLHAAALRLRRLPADRSEEPPTRVS